MAAKETGLEYILGGGALIEFPQHELPTTRDVLRFYSQFWRSKSSDSVREKTVALELKQIYESRNMNSMSTFGIMSKIKREVTALKRVLKFKAKEKTHANIQTENHYRGKLSEVFDIAEILRQPSERNTPMEVDDQDKVFSMFTFSLNSFP